MDFTKYKIEYKNNEERSEIFGSLVNIAKTMGGELKYFNDLPTPAHLNRIKVGKDIIHVTEYLESPIVAMSTTLGKEERNLVFGYFNYKGINFKDICNL